MREISDPRPVDKDRVVRDVVICDGSKIKKRDAETLVETIVKPTLQIFSGTSDARTIAQLTEAVGKNVPLTFLGIQARQTDNGWKATSMSRYIIYEATGTKAEKLKAEYEQIEALDAPIMSLQHTYEGPGGPSLEELKTRPGMETFCAHLSDVRIPTGVPDMDSATTIWQMN